MLVLHHHPENKTRSAPKFISSSQKLYPRTKVDAESTWTVEYEGLGQAVLTATLNRLSEGEPTFTASCEKGDLHIDGEFPRWLFDGDLGSSADSTRSTVATGNLYHRAQVGRVDRRYYRVKAVYGQATSWWSYALRGGRGGEVYPRWKERE